MLKIKGVVGTGTTQLADGKHAILIMTKEAGLEASLPKALEGVPVVVEVSGEFTAFSHQVRPGNSTSNVAVCAAGTIGCIATKSGQKQFLSNHHVFAQPPCSGSAIGADIVHPGRLDVAGCGIHQTVADLTQFVPIVFSSTASNRVDAAIAKIRTGVSWTTTTKCGYTPSSTTTTASVGMSVKKCGRTTNFTTGRVTAVNVTALINYGSCGTARFIGQISFTAMSSPGDSGSLIVSNVSSTANRPVALLFAGSSTVTIGNRIQDVTSLLGITIN